MVLSTKRHYTNWRVNDTKKKYLKRKLCDILTFQINANRRNERASDNWTRFDRPRNQFGRSDRIVFGRTVVFRHPEPSSICREKRQTGLQKVLECRWRLPVELAQVEPRLVDDEEGRFVEDFRNFCRSQDSWSGWNRIRCHCKLIDKNIFVKK